MAELDDYTSLVTSEHQPRPKFIATVSALVSPIVDQINLLAGMTELFDLDEAVGDQQDTLGEWIGLSRDVSTPLAGVYFSFDISGLGFDQGAWMGPYDPVSGLVSLDDPTYLMTLRAKIAANHWDGSSESAEDIIDMLAPAGTYVFLEDPCDMSITIGVSGNLPSAVYFALLKTGLLTLKPESVLVNYAVTSVEGAAIFGFDMDNEYVSGFDSGAWAVTSIAGSNELNYTFILDYSTLS